MFSALPGARQVAKDVLNLTDCAAATEILVQIQV